MHWIEWQALIFKTKKGVDDASEEELEKYKKFAKEFCDTIREKNIDSLKEFLKKYNLTTEIDPYFIENSDAILARVEELFDDIFKERQVEVQTEEQLDSNHDFFDELAKAISKTPPS